ncbi:AMP-binding protein [Algoriphagus sp. CAU 1675]|uniref:AMP-binding protein n=1 Tax=Algoriphagus sp. CAU 1675 TaxID=3032597 RepID=UPI0023DC3548|nr:AMP-binding protein [Algoriphagus sp. CAU 1675]MDF2158298.1 AMP-binding protein [Algoriphagus sp. CAU 1675]
MFRLIFQNHSFSQPSDFQKIPGDFPEFAIEALHFCKEWLSGKETFTLQTSGSTGKPKQIQIHKSQMIESAKATGEFFKINPTMNLLCCLNPRYIAGKMMLVRAMVWNCNLLLVESSSNPLSTIPSGFEPNFIALVPLQVQTLLENEESTKILQRIKNIIIGGAPIHSGLKQKLEDLQIHAWQTYGMTETVSHIALAPIKSGELHYQILPGVEIGTDSRGALWIKSPMSNEEKIQTNDLVRLDSKYSFSWLGRADFVINSGGIKIHPELLESKMEPSIHYYFPGSLFFLSGKPDERLGQKLILLIESQEKDPEKIDLLLVDLKNKVTRFEFPREIRLIDKFDLTPNGKIDRIKTLSKA